MQTQSFSINEYRFQTCKVCYLQVLANKDIISVVQDESGKNQNAKYMHKRQSLLERLVRPVKSKEGYRFQEAESLLIPDVPLLGKEVRHFAAHTGVTISGAQHTTYSGSSLFWHLALAWRTVADIAVVQRLYKRKS